MAKAEEGTIVADISQFFDKSYEKQRFKELADAPIEAVRGLSESDADALKRSHQVSRRFAT